MRDFPEVAAWQGIRYGKAELLERAALEDRELPPQQRLLIYGDVQLSAAEKEALSLPHKFTTYQAIKEEDLAVAAEVMATKIKWETKAREDRKVGEEDKGEWTEEWEVQKLQEKEIFSPEENKISHSKRYCTDLPTNRRITPPAPLPVAQSVIINNLKDKLKAVGAAYLKDSCDKDGYPLRQNLPPETRAGIKTLQKRVKEGEIAVMPTDKSGRLSVNWKENYLELMNTHVQGDSVITMEEQSKLERECNDHSAQ